MSFILYGAKCSTLTQRVVTAFAFHGQEFEFRAVDILAFDARTPEHKKLNPFGQVPVLQHGDFTLFESRAIIKYLDRVLAPKSGKSLMPADPKKMGLVEQWMSVDAERYQPHLLTVLFAYLGFQGKVDSVEFKQAQEKIGVVYDVLESHFDDAAGKYLVGDEYTAADLCFTSVTNWYLSHNPNVFDSRPRVAAWWKLITAEAAWKEAHEWFINDPVWASVQK